MFSCGLAFALHYVECVNVPDIVVAGPRVEVPSVVNVKIMISSLGYRHANEADAYKENSNTTGCGCTTYCTLSSLLSRTSL